MPEKPSKQQQSEQISRSLDKGGNGSHIKNILHLLKENPRRENDPQFFVDRLVQRIGFDRISERLAPYAAILFVLVVLFFDLMLSAYNYSQRGEEVYNKFFPTPWWNEINIIFVPLILIIAIISLRKFRREHNNAIQVIQNNNGESSVENVSISQNLQIGMLILGSIIYAIWLYTAFAEIVKATGLLLAVIKWLVIFPCVYLPLATDLAMMYLQIQIVVPFRIRDLDVPLDFSDPKRLGGLAPVGRSMTSAAQMTFGALILYTVVWSLIFIRSTQYNSSIQTNLSIQIAVILFFILAWVFAILSFACGLLILHRHMTKQRREEFYEIYDRIQDICEDREPFPVTVSKDEDFQACMVEYVNLDHVERTRTFPVRSVIGTMVLSAISPVIQVLTAILPYLSVISKL